MYKVELSLRTIVGVAVRMDIVLEPCGSTYWACVSDQHSCNGPQTRSLGLANKGSFQLAIRANKTSLGPTLAANEPTLGSWPVLVMWFGGTSQVYIDGYV